MGITNRWLFCGPHVHYKRTDLGGYGGTARSVQKSDTKHLHRAHDVEHWGAKAARLENPIWVILEREEAQNIEAQKAETFGEEIGWIKVK